MNKSYFTKTEIIYGSTEKVLYIYKKRMPNIGKRACMSKLDFEMNIHKGGITHSVVANK